MEGARTMPYKDPQKRREYRCKYYKEYYEKNPDKKERKKRKARERANAYYAANADEVKIKNRIYHAPHRRAYTESGGKWECCKCGSTWDDGVQLDVHHKDMNNENNDPSNLVCLCKECHDSLHRTLIKEVIPELMKRGVIEWDGTIK